MEQWWSELVSVPKGSGIFEVNVSWSGAGSDLDLHLMSPSGRHYGSYADITGYSGPQTNPQQFRVPKPEPGVWRISVQAVRGGEESIMFGVNTSGVPTNPHLVAGRQLH